MMDGLSFADILMILVVCGIIFAILKLGSRSAQKNQLKQKQTDDLPASESAENISED